MAIYKVLVLIIVIAAEDIERSHGLPDGIVDDALDDTLKVVNSAVDIVVGEENGGKENDGERNSGTVTMPEITYDPSVYISKSVDEMDSKLRELNDKTNCLNNMREQLEQAKDDVTKRFMDCQRDWKVKVQQLLGRSNGDVRTALVTVINLEKNIYDCEEKISDDELYRECKKEAREDLDENMDKLRFLDHEIDDGYLTIKATLNNCVAPLYDKVDDAASDASKGCGMCL